MHVATGIAAIPLLLAKLWTVFPKLFVRPPVHSVAHAVERVSHVPLVAGSVFMVFSGVANIARWYPWRFSFPVAHYGVAWITMGALIAHIGAKAVVVRRALGPSGAAEVPGDGLGRRGFLVAVGAGSAVLTLATVGQTVRSLSRAGLLAPRRPRVGPQGLPVNKSAASARVIEAAMDENWRLVVDGRVDRPLSLSLSDLQAMPQHAASLPISCVEGWSSTADWTGVRVRDLLEHAGAGSGRHVLVESLQRKGGYKSSRLTPAQAADHDTLLALTVNGGPLHIDHGFPVRLIGPNRPGVLQTKWVARMRVMR
jgi:hypothetical protein